MCIRDSGNALWSHALHSLEGGVRHLIIDERLGNLPDHVFAVGQNAIADVTRDEAGVTSTPFAAFDQPIAAVYNMRSATSLEPALALVVFLEDGAIHGLSSRGEEMERLAWPLRLGSRPSATDVSGEGAAVSYTHLDVYKRQSTAWPT